MLSAPEPLRVAVLSSRRAPGLKSVVSHSLHGALYQIVGIVSSEEEFAEAAFAKEIGIRLVHRPVRAFHRACGRPLHDMAVRAAYDDQLVPLLRSWSVDLVFCCGYLYLLTAPVLDMWAGAVFNVHHSDMLARNDDGRVRYPGLRAVRDAILDGAVETRSTVHVVTPTVDDGPPVLRSWAFPVSPLAADMRNHGSADALKAYIFAHQEWMLQRAWAPLITHALELASLDRSGLARGQLLGAPWEITVHGQLRATYDAAQTAVSLPRSTWR